jgi:hypothetical protein
MTDDLTRLLALDACLRAYGTGLSTALGRLLEIRTMESQRDPKLNQPSNVVAFPALHARQAMEARHVRN